MNTKPEPIRTSIPWPVDVSRPTLQEQTSHSNNSQRVLTVSIYSLIRRVCAYWYCRSIPYTRYPGSQYPRCCRYIISRRGYTRNDNKKSYHPCVLLYQIQILSTAEPGICYMLVRGRTWYLYILVYLVGYGPTAVCTVFYFGGRFDTPGAMPPCIVRNTYCMVHMGPFARNSGALAMSFFRARLLV